MFKEIMSNVTDFLSISKPGYLESEDTIPIAKYLSLGYDIPADSIIKVKSFKIAPEIPRVILVDVDFDTAKRIVDYTIINGELCKVISFDTTLMRASEENTIATMIGLFGDVTLTIPDHYMPMINTAHCNMSFSNILSYAPVVMFMAYINEIAPFIEDEKIASILGYMNPKITETSIASIRKLISLFTIEALFDNAVWYGVSNTEYPEIRYNETFNQDELDQYDSLWESGSDKGDDLCGYDDTEDLC